MHIPFSDKPAAFYNLDVIFSVAAKVISRLFLMRNKQGRVYELKTALY
jgi:hypothetical protein